MSHTFVVVLIVNQPLVHKVFDRILRRGGLSAGLDSVHRRGRRGVLPAAASRRQDLLTSSGGLLPVSQM